MADTHFDADGGGSANFLDTLSLSDPLALSGPFNFFDTGSTADLSTSLFPTTPPTSGGDFLSAITGMANNAAAAAKLYYGTQGQIYAAKNNAALINAQGVNAVQTAKTGLPSPNALLIGGFGLAAILLLTSRK